MRNHRVSQMFDRLALAETRFLNQEFFAPVITKGEVRVRIDGVVCQLKIEPEDFRGWGVFQPISTTLARFSRLPSLHEQQSYLRLFPAVSLVLCDRNTLTPNETLWHAMHAHRGDARFQITGQVPVRLVEDAEAFDVVRTRFDGANFWFESLDSTRDFTTAAFLRDSLGKLVPPRDLKRGGLTPEERAAYKICYQQLTKQEHQQHVDQTESRLRSALDHAGAKFVSYTERGDGYRVTYRLGNCSMTTSVEKENLNVQVAGICLSGEDQKFDLKSLIGVLNAGGSNTVAIGQENDGMSEQDYWSMYGH